MTSTAQDSVGRRVDDVRGQVGGAAGQQAREVADKTMEQAGQVISVSADELKQMAQRVTEDLQQQASGQTERVAGNVRKFSEQLRAVSEGRPGEAGEVTGYLTQAASRVEHFAGRLESGGIEGVARDVSRFARRRPVVFLVGAVAAGLMAGRFARAQRDASQSEKSENRHADDDWALPAETGVLVEPSNGMPGPAGMTAGAGGVAATPGARLGSRSAR